MSLLILLIYLGSHGVLSAPTQTPAPLSSTERHLPSSKTQSCDPTLTIAWECLTTLFACSWAAVHPNISPFRSSSHHSTFIRAELMIWTILAPECIVYWALRQWFGARKLKKIYQSEGWTMAHGFFLQMGGFVLVEANNFKEVLTPNRFDYLHSQSLIEFPNIAEREIKGRSKKGAIAKTVAVLQIASFVVRFAIRRQRGHATTQLELGTLVFTGFSFILTFLWWEKPLDVHLPILVYKPNSTKADGLSYTGLSGASDVSKKACHESSEEAQEDDRSPLVGSSNHPIGKKSTLFQFVSKIKVVVLNKWRQFSGFAACLTVSNIKDVVRNRLQQFSGYEDDALEPKMAVPVFFSSKISDNEHVVLSIAVAAMGVIFGVIHYLAGNFPFPSTVEKQIWKICSLIVLAYPAAQLALMLPAFMSTHASKTKLGPDIEDFADEVWNMGSAVFMFLIPFYIIARLIIVAETFAALRGLPLSASSGVN